MGFRLTPVKTFDSTNFYGKRMTFHPGTFYSFIEKKNGYVLVNDMVFTKEEAKNLFKKYLKLPIVTIGINN